MVQIPLNSGSPTQPAGIPAGLPDLFAPAPVVALEPLFLPWTLLIDHREREGGWRFQGITGDSKDKYRPLVIKQQECTLKTADYTIEDCPVFVERKSVSDFISTVTHGHENFRKEHFRMQEIIAAGGSCCVIIEGEYNAIIDELESGTSPRNVHPASIRGAVTKMPMEFGVPWYFAGTRRRAEELCFWILRSEYQRRNGQ